MIIKNDKDLNSALAIVKALSSTMNIGNVTDSGVMYLAQQINIIEGAIRVYKINRANKLNKIK